MLASTVWFAAASVFEMRPSPSTSRDSNVAPFCCWAGWVCAAVSRFRHVREEQKNYYLGAQWNQAVANNQAMAVEVNRLREQIREMYSDGGDDDGDEWKKTPHGDN